MNAGRIRDLDLLCIHTYLLYLHTYMNTLHTLYGTGCAIKGREKREIKRRIGRIGARDVRRGKKKKDTLKLETI